MAEYTHLLIPARNEMVPGPEQVVDFVQLLLQAGVLPIDPSISVGLQSGQVRSAINPITGQPVSYSRRKIEQVATPSELAHAIAGSSDYNICIAGNGPSRVPPFQFAIGGEYQFNVNICLRPQLVSMSDPHDIDLPDYHVPEFGVPCDLNQSIGIYCNPNSLAKILVCGGGCSRFWIEFGFGKSLFPTIAENLEIINPEIIKVAGEHFQSSFIQGCYWCA